MYGGITDVGWQHVAAKMVPLLIARQVLARFSPNRARSRHLRGRTVHASPTAFPAVIRDIPPRHQAVVGVRGAGRLGGGSFDRCRRRLDDIDEHFVGVDSLSVNSAEVTAMSHALLNVLWL